MSPVGQPVNQREKPYRPAGLARGPLVQSGRPLTLQLILLSYANIFYASSQRKTHKKGPVETRP